MIDENSGAPAASRPPRKWISDPRIGQASPVPGFAGMSASVARFEFSGKTSSIFNQIGRRIL